MGLRNAGHFFSGSVSLGVDLVILVIEVLRSPFSC